MSSEGFACPLEVPEPNIFREMRVETFDGVGISSKTRIRSGSDHCEAHNLGSKFKVRIPRVHAVERDDVGSSRDALIGTSSSIPANRVEGGLLAVNDAGFDHRIKEDRFDRLGVFVATIGGGKR